MRRSSIKFFFLFCVFHYRYISAVGGRDTVLEMVISLETRNKDNNSQRGLVLVKEFKEE